MKNKFDHLFLLGRPASGKSEFIDYMKKLPDEDRAKNFHLAKFEEIDDFFWIWQKFMDDEVWEKAGYPRMYSKEYMKGNPGLTREGASLLDYCMEKFNAEIKKKYLSNESFYNDKSLIIEFARGGQKMYKHSLPRINAELWKRAAILYIDVSADDSWRRNVARYEEKLRHSSLAHMVPKETYDFHFRDHDWYDVTQKNESGYLELNGVKVPYVTMNNEPELPPGPEIGERYKKALDKLFKLYDTVKSCHE